MGMSEADVKKHILDTVSAWLEDHHPSNATLTLHSHVEQNVPAGKLMRVVRIESSKNHALCTIEVGDAPKIVVPTPNVPPNLRG